MRILFFILTLNNFYYTVLTTLSTTTGIQILVMAIYWCLTIPSILIMAMTFIKKDMKYVRPAMLLLTIRNILRLYNLENYSDTPYQQVIQNLVCLFLGQTYIINSENTTINTYCGRFIMIFYSTGVCKTFEMINLDSWLSGIFSLFWVVMGTLLCYGFLKV
jgi:hypothetical protein